MHLREFRVNMWILLQGQNVACKILPKSKRHTYISYDEGSKSVIYYNVETQRCLTSRNYTFLTPKTGEDDVEDNTKQHDNTCKGERQTLEWNVQPEDKKNNREQKRKREEEEEDSPLQPPPQKSSRRTQGVKRDYR